MIYTNLTKKAINIMCDAHTGQVDKGGYPYFLHPLHVANEMDDEISTVVALLHDVVEDSNYTLEDLNCFGSEVLDALSLLTKKKGEDYFDYIKKLAPNPIARKVKLADLKHNSDLSRLSFVTVKDLIRRDKYLKCIDYLEGIDKKKNSGYQYQKSRKFA